MKSKQSGFTLIELVMVIIVLGILAAVAVPKMIDLDGAATTAKGSYNKASTAEENQAKALCNKAASLADIASGKCT